MVPADGKPATKLTNGAAEQIRHRYVRLDPDEEFIDSARPVFVSLFGVWTKQSGYARLNLSSGQVERLILLDKAVQGLGKAKDADVYGYVVQDFDDPPDALVGGPSLKDAKPIVDDERLLHRLRMGPLGTGRIQERARRAFTGSAVLSRRIRARQEIPDGRLHVREAVGRPPPLEHPFPARAIQRRGVHQPGIRRSSSRTSCSGPANPGCRWPIASDLR